MKHPLLNNSTGPNTIHTLLLSLAAAAAFAPASIRAQDAGVWRTAYFDRAVPVGEAPAPAQVSRCPVLLAFGGPKIKIYEVGFLSSDVNLEKVTLVKAAQVADGRTIWDGSISPPIYPISFSGKESLTIPKGGGDCLRVASDESAVPVTSGLWYIQQSFQKGSKTPYSWDNDGGFVAVSHDAPSASAGGGRFGAFRVDVLTKDTRPLIACCGDSITSSAGATRLKGVRFPDLLSKDLDLPALDVAINGGSFETLSRTDVTRDLAGVKIVLIDIGGNDIHNGMTEEAYIKHAASHVADLRSRDPKLKILWCTIIPGPPPPLPTPYTPAMEKIRERLNDWIRGNAMGADAIVDWDKAIADPQHPTRRTPGYQDRDPHPNDAGNAVLANATADVIRKLLAAPAASR
jgi:lysophospholipase L1-like esterase